MCYCEWSEPVTIYEYKMQRKGKVQMKNWDNVVLVPEFDEQGVACYRLEGGDYENLHRLDGLA